MKGRKLLALALFLALTLGLAAPVLAVEGETVQDHTAFADLQSQNWSWAWATIDDTIRRGLFVGYEPTTDARGNTITNFGPGDKVTESVGLTLCARMMVEKEQREQILNDRLDEMRQLIPGTAANPDAPAAPFMWFRREAAVCLELGIIQASELEALRTGDRLGEPMTKADFAKYLVRAMGLEDFARGLNADELPFNDEAKIQREYRPYVKLLSTYGVLTGDENNNFNPDDGMTRAVCATMLSRAIVNIKEGREVTVDLPRYTTYDWTTGYIRQVELQEDGSRVVKLQSDITGMHSVILPSGVSIYQHNMKAGTTELKVGTFARVCYDQGVATMVRLTPAGFLSQIEGECTEVTDESVVVDGVAYTIDRFTEVSAGGWTGDRSVLDAEAGYTAAKLVTNSRKSVLSLELTGGTRKVEGLVTAVTTDTSTVSNRKTTITIDPFNGGLSASYVLGKETALTVNGRKVSNLDAAQVKDHRAVLRVNDSDGTLVAVDVDTASQYVQGVLKNYDVLSEPNRAELRLVGADANTAYEVDSACVITYEEVPALLSWIPLEVFVTAEVDGGTMSRLSAWSGSETATGTLTGLVRGEETVVLEVALADGSQTQFSIPTDQMKAVNIKVDGQNADIGKVTTGVDVTITVRHQKVTAIDANPRPADVTGTLNAVTFGADATRLTIVMADGTTKEFTVAPTATITLDGKLVDAAQMVNARGRTVALVTEEGKALSIQLAAEPTELSVLEGTVENTVDADGVVVILAGSSESQRLVKVRVAQGTTIITAAGEKLDSAAALKTRDAVQIYGAYAVDGVFEAKSVIRK